MVTITKTEIDVKDIRELAAAYKDIAEGFGSVSGSGSFEAPDYFAKTASILLKFISIDSNQFEGLGVGVKISASQ